MEHDQEQSIKDIPGFVADHEVVYELRRMAAADRDAIELDKFIRQRLNCSADEFLRPTVYYRLAFKVTIQEAMDIVGLIKQDATDSAMHIIMTHGKDWR